jgi:hypothetical protein
MAQRALTPPKRPAPPVFAAEVELTLAPVSVALSLPEAADPVAEIKVVAPVVVTPAVAGAAEAPALAIAVVVTLPVASVAAAVVKSRAISEAGIVTVCTMVLLSLKELKPGPPSDMTQVATSDWAWHPIE